MIYNLMKKFARCGFFCYNESNTLIVKLLLTIKVNQGRWREKDDI
jgi:hypothetical protein